MALVPAHIRTFTVIVAIAVKGIFPLLGQWSVELDFWDTGSSH